MSDDRMRILTMLANGKITPQEAENLLLALHEEPSAENPRAALKNPKFLCVKVTGNDTVDVRVPIGILRTGIKLTALIPPQAMGHIEEHMKERGFNFDLSRFKREDVDELISNLAEMEVNVASRNGDNVRVYCE
ncbi:MAG: hypothetical protein PHC61_16265 [Chitinivibrionales bacterium]|nr:hypothetical protein [Chitinivibrionales bacterium]